MQSETLPAEISGPRWGPDQVWLIGEFDLQLIGKLYQGLHCRAMCVWDDVAAVW
jgi:hypothetical protein